MGWWGGSGAQPLVAIFEVAFWGSLFFSSSASWPTLSSFLFTRFSYFHLYLSLLIWSQGTRIPLHWHFIARLRGMAIKWAVVLSVELRGSCKPAQQRQKLLFWRRHFVHAPCSRMCVFNILLICTSVSHIWNWRGWSALRHDWGFLSLSHFDCWWNTHTHTHKLKHIDEFLHINRTHSHRQFCTETCSWACTLTRQIQTHTLTMCYVMLCYVKSDTGGLFYHLYTHTRIHTRKHVDSHSPRQFLLLYI